MSKTRLNADFDKNIAQPAEREERVKAIEEYTKRGRPKFC
jgi:hypothetical protein